MRRPAHSVHRMDHRNAAAEVGARITHQLDATGRSQRWLAEAANIPETTLRRRLGGGSDFFVAEIVAIAKALGLPPSDLLPSAFAREAVAP